MTGANDDIVMHDAASTTTVVSTSSVSSQSSANSSSSQQTVGKPKKPKTKHPKIFQCTGYGDCRMTFTRSEHLARHIRKHTGERPFRCHCNRTFSRLDNLRQHIQTVHANEHHILHAPPPPPLHVSSKHQPASIRMTSDQRKGHHHHHHTHQSQSTTPVSAGPYSSSGAALSSKAQQPLPPLPHDQQQHIIIEHHPINAGGSSSFLPVGQIPQHHTSNETGHAMSGANKHRPQPLALKGGARNQSYPLEERSSPISPAPHSLHSNSYDTAYPPSSPYGFSALPSPVPPSPPPPPPGLQQHQQQHQGHAYYPVPPLPVTPINAIMPVDHQNPTGYYGTQQQHHQQQQQHQMQIHQAQQYSTPPYDVQASTYRVVSNGGPLVLTPASSRHQSSNISSPASSTTTRTTSWLSSVLNDSSPQQGLSPVEERPHTWGPSSKRFSSNTDDGERNSMAHLISITEDAHISTPIPEDGVSHQLSPAATPVSEPSKLPSISALFGDQKPPLLSANRSYTKNLILPRPESYPPPKGFPPVQRLPMADMRPSPVSENGPSARTTAHLSKPLPPLPNEVGADASQNIQAIEQVSQEQPGLSNGGGMDMLMQAAGV